LTGIVLQGNDLTGANLAGQNLSYARFESAKLDRANLSHANFANARFDVSTLTGANLSHANLTNASFNFSYHNLAGADFTGADARGASFQNDDPFRSANTTNFIRANGQILGLDLRAGASLVVRDYHDNPPASPPTAPITIVVQQGMTMDASGTLRLLFDADHWDSTISFAPRIAVTRGGTLDLSFADGVKVDSQWHRTIHLFDWDGVTPTGNFNLNSRYLWDQSALYTSGDVTLAALPGDANEDGAIDFKDLVTVAQHYSMADGLQGWSDGDFTFDGKVDFSDLIVIAQNYGTRFVDLPNNVTPAFAADWAAATTAVAPEPGGAAIAMAVMSLLWRRNGRSQRSRSRGKD
jgi:uncharacterized protein YjbI with pentapeptide repeats